MKSFIMANINANVSQLPHTQLMSGSEGTSYYDNYDRSILCDIDPDLNYLDSACKVNAEYYTEQSFNDNFSNNCNFSLMHLNIRSIPLHFTELLCYLDSLNIEFKLIALSETALNDTHTDFKMPNYNCEIDVRPKRKGGGVSLYIHSALQYKLRRDLQLCGDANSVFIEIYKTTTNTKHNIICGCVYRPPSMSLNIFNDMMTTSFNKMQHENKYLYITGDFNVNTLFNVKGGLSTQHFKNIFSTNYCFPFINKPTRVTDHSASLIDNIYSNIPSQNCFSGILKTSISDHYGIFCIDNDCNLNNDKVQIVKRSFTLKNIANFKNCLQNVTWDFVYLSDDIESAYQRFQGVLDQLLNTNFKKQTYTMNYKNRHPWMTAALRAQIKQKNKLHSLAISSRDDKIMDDYKETKKNLQSALRNSEITYFSNQLDIHRNDMGKSWKVLRNILGKDHNKRKKHHSFFINNNYVTDSLQIANAFNKFFVSIGSLLAKKIKSDVNPLLYVDNNVNSIATFEVTSNRVRNVILSLNNSSAGHDELPPFVAKSCIEEFIEPLTYMINESLRTGICPSELKIARVVPIFKSGDPSLLTNYRPISVLSFFSKVFERIVYDYLFDFICTNNILYDYQFGFRPGHSTQQAIITLIDKITKSLDNDDIVISLFIDLKKAFDTVDHRILLRKLYAYGIRGTMLKWIESYLSGRTQYVVFDGQESEIHGIQCGVPQGSILGPLLFILYMNDICNVSDIFFAIMYADDTSLVVNGKDLNALIQLLNTALIDLCTWFKANRLSLNTTKTFYMIFHRARIKHMSGVADSIVMDNTILAKTSSLKYLGVIVDHKLNWIEHISYVRNKVSKGIGIMYKARRFLNKKSLLSLYHSYIYPYLIYCIEVWGCAAPSHLHSLFLLQKKIVRIMTFAPYLAHTEPIFNSLELLPVEKIFINRVSIVMFKFSCNMLPDPIAKLYSKNKDYHSHNTRNKNHLKVPTGTKNFTSNSARIWNTISTKIDVNVTFVQFKANLKLYLLNNVL